MKHSQRSLNRRIRSNLIRIPRPYPSRPVYVDRDERLNCILAGVTLVLVILLGGFLVAQEHSIAQAARVEHAR